MLISLLDKMDEKLEALFDWVHRRLWLEAARVTAIQRPSVRPRLEALEDRLVPADVFAGVGAWSNVALWSLGRLPGANDDATIAAGATCTLSGQTPTVQSLTVNGTLNVEDTLTVAVNGNPGSGTTTISTAGGGAGVLTIGSSNSQEDAKLDTNTFNDLGTTTVGGPSATGSSADLDAVFINLGNTSGAGGILNIGDPGAGHAGSVDVSNTMTVNGPSTLNVGGVNNSGGTLDVATLTSAGGVVVNTNGEMDVKSAATLAGVTTVGGEIKAENINDTQGAAVALSGATTVSGTGKLSAEINASFTVTPGNTLTLLPDSAVGSALNDGQFIIDGTLAVDTNLDPDGDITLDEVGSITGTGSLDEWHDFTWSGGTLGLSGGTTIEPQAEFKTDGTLAKTLASDLTNICLSTESNGPSVLTITAGNTFTNASGTVAVSLPIITGAGTFTNAAGATVQIETPASYGGLTISAILDNEGTLDCETAAAPLTLSDASGKSLLNGKLALNNDSLTIAGLYTTTGSFDENWSPTDLTQIVGTLTVDQSASADFDHVVLYASSSSVVVTGAGDFSIGASGLNTGDYLKWLQGTMSGTGTTTIGPNATLYMQGSGTMGRDLDNQGTVEWPVDSGISFSSGTTVHNEKGGLFDCEDTSSGYIPTFNNDGTLELNAGTSVSMDTFTQSSTGTLQSDIASGSLFGALSVSGTATLDGTLQAQLENGYQPPSGTSFKVLTFASNSGPFATVRPSGWSAQYDSTSVSLVAP